MVSFRFPDCQHEALRPDIALKMTPRRTQREQIPGCIEFYGAYVTPVILEETHVDQGRKRYLDIASLHVRETEELQRGKKV